MGKRPLTDCDEIEKGVPDMMNRAVDERAHVVGSWQAYEAWMQFFLALGAIEYTA